MIRSDPDRPGVTIVDVANFFVAELSEEWSTPVQVKIENDELVLRDLEPVELDPSTAAFIQETEGQPLTLYRIPSSRGAEEAAS